MVIELHQHAEGALPLLRTLAGDSRTQDIPVIVAQCENELMSAQAQRIGNVVVLMGDCAPDTLAAEVDRVLLGRLARAARVRLGFPVTCPQLRGRTGVPRSVSTTANRGTYITCVRKCAQQWRVFRHAVSPSAKLGSGLEI